MIRDKASIKGKMTATVFGPDGKVKRRKRRWFEKLLGLQGRPMISVNHNIVTDEGDALIVDMLVTTGTQTAVDNANGVIGVGTGFVSELKTTDALVTQEGVNEAMDPTYPKQKGAFGAALDNIIQYRSIFEAGDLDAVGIDEALLGNGTDTLAYAQITPTVDVTLADTLQVDWEITFLGA